MRGELKTTGASHETRYKTYYKAHHKNRDQIELHSCGPQPSLSCGWAALSIRLQVATESIAIDYLFKQPWR